MDIILNKTLQSIMTKDVKTVGPLCLGTEIAEIFNTQKFHHLPVVDEENTAIGIISAADYKQLQHHFTRLQIARSDRENEKIMRSILAKEIMTEDPYCMDENSSIADAVEIFIKNDIHSIIVEREGKIAGIVTPIDILKSVVGPALINK